MNRSPFDPQRLDVPRFARESGLLEGPLDLERLQRVRDELRDDARLAPVGHFRADGMARSQRGGAFETWIALTIEAELPLTCQRCLTDMTETLHIERELRFVATEEQAEKLDQEQEDDVLVVSKQFDLWALIEDEILMAMPHSARHEECPEIQQE
jgi:uncharacterized protein